jgi:hypothetical protein
MKKDQGKQLRRFFLFMFAFVIALTIVNIPINVSAKAGNPEVKASKKTLYVGYESYKITVSNLAKGAAVTCKSDNPKVAKVDKSNRVTGLKQGKAKITVQIKQNGKSYKDSITITVKDPYVKITEYKDTMKVNTSKTWKAKVYGSKNTTLSWSSSDTSVASVNKNTGKLTAHSAGKVKVTVTAGRLKASKTVVVQDSDSAGTKKDDAKITTRQKDFVLQWDICPEVLPMESFDHFSIIEDDLPERPIWSTSDSELAQIDQDGWVSTGSKEGTVIIKARVGNKQISAAMLILTEENYTDYIYGYYKPTNHIEDNFELVEEDSTELVELIPTPIPETAPTPGQKPNASIAKPTPIITPKPGLTPVPEENKSDYTFDKSSEGITITGLKNKNLTNLVIPSEINGEAVVRIRSHAFLNLDNIQSIVIPDTVTAIEYEAIKACPNLESLTIPASVTNLRDVVDCPKLKYLTIGIEKVNGATFRSCKAIERITVLEGAKEISGFHYFSSLREVILPESMQVIAKNAFTYCINLQKINIPDGVEEIGSEAFAHCNNLTRCTISDSFSGNIDKYAFYDSSIGSIAGAYKYNCLAVLNENDRMLYELAQEIIQSEINPSDHNGLKVLAIHDWIVRNTEYDYDNYLHNTIPWSSYGAEGVLLNHRAVCEGYSEAFNLFMSLLDIPCHVVVGSAGGEGHAWNLVYLDGEWYHIDCTWDDPVPDRGPDNVGYYYCLLPDFLVEQMDRVWNRSQYPAANGTKWTDYVIDNFVVKY